MKFLFFITFMLFISCGQSGSVSNAHKASNSNLKWDESKFPLIIKVPKSYESNQNFKNALESAVTTWNNAIGKNALELAYEGDDIVNKELNGLYYLTPSDYLNNDDIFMVSLPNFWFSDFCTSSKNNPSRNFLSQYTNKSDCESNSFVWIESDIGEDVLAVTSWKYSGGEIIHADIIFNVEDNRFSTSPPIGGIFDYESAMVHELGHFLGFTHVSSDEDPDSVMNSSIAPNEKRRVLSQGDYDRLKDRY